MSVASVGETLRGLALEYPPEMRAHQLQDIPRIAYHIGLVLRLKGRDISICDIGGGVGLFSLGCAAVGMKVTLVDDFRDPVNESVGLGVLELHRSHGVTILSRDVIGEGISFPNESLDAVTSFDNIEHLHNSPKALYHAAVAALKDGGLFLLGSPNALNLRKRIAVPLGWARWSAMEDWYERPIFRGHVREPNLSDLRYIARDLGLTRVRYFGRNWLAREGGGVKRTVNSLIDRPLRWFPSLCSDIYVAGFKPSHSRREVGGRIESERSHDSTNRRKVVLVDDTSRPLAIWFNGFP
jgi:SAM-dependent methyltransferase